MGIEKWQIKAIYALANSLGLLETLADNKTDTLHELVQTLTQKSSIRELSKEEANKVIERLRGNMRGFKHHNITEAQGMISKGQEKKIWALLYEIKKYDIPGEYKTETQMSKRLTGFLKKYAGVSDMRFLTYEKANKIIEGLKGAIASQKRRG